MRKVVLAYAAESEPMPEGLSRLLDRLRGNIEVAVVPISGNASSISNRVKAEAKRANFLMILFSAKRETADVAAVWLGSLTAEERHALSNMTEVLFVFPSGECADIPGCELRGFSCYDLSSPFGTEALLCKLVHDPVDRRRVDHRTKRWEATKAVLNLTMGAIGTVLSTNDKIKDLLLDQFGEGVSRGVHYFMSVVVLVFVFAGLIFLLRLGVDLVRPILTNLQPFVGRRSLSGMACVMTGFFGWYFFPRAPEVDENVNKHLREWVQRLEGSQRDNGGVREHPDKGVAQVWSTAQSLSGLLSAQRWSTNASQAGHNNWAESIQRAIAFMDRARIVSIELRENRKRELMVELQQFAKEADFSKLPGRFPTFAVALASISRIAGKPDAPFSKLEMLVGNPDRYFTTKGPFEGWGYYEQFEWGVTEVAAWVALAQIQSLRTTNPVVWKTEQDRERVKRRIKEVARHIQERQLPQIGAFTPIADTTDFTFARTYSTIMAIWAMAEAASPDLGIFSQSEVAALETSMRDAMEWLRDKAITDKSGIPGWKLNPSNPTGEEPFLGLAAQTLCVIGRLPIRLDLESQTKFTGMRKRILAAADQWADRQLRDNDRMHDADSYLYPTSKVIEPSTFLWYPWCVSLLRSLSEDPAMTPKQQAEANKWLKRLRARAGEFGRVVAMDYNYVGAEALLGFTWPMKTQNK